MNPAGRFARLLSFDATITAALTLPKEQRILRILALLAAHSGDSPVWAGILAAVWFLGDPAWRPIVIITVAGMAAAELLTIIIKISVRRPRPEGDLGGIYRKTDPYSFPSGHAARAAMLAIVSGLYCPPLLLAGILVWSPLMLLSRIAIGIHYVFDILAGLVMGTGITLVIIEVVRFIVERM